eukprot:CAMPEP_0172088358 /NCGR_PEP_ID=MMETSP1043-20130122/23191_1 /TAXON_ID=464988 /ORGANISM="Hemiselmis andersenii, Strain CCMP441" /LENGTH=96 /DNA_ID=CAMNT_0012750657 /DNA_START=109 /DNA_END=396 /DNA_ORIENTATION=+
MWVLADLQQNKDGLVLKLEQALWGLLVHKGRLSLGFVLGYPPHWLLLILALARRGPSANPRPMAGIVRVARPAPGPHRVTHPCFSLLYPCLREPKP